MKKMCYVFFYHACYLGVFGVVLSVLFLFLRGLIEMNTGASRQGDFLK